MRKLKNSHTPKIVSMGRLIEYLGLELVWSTRGANLKLPNGDYMPLRMDNFCPHVTKDLNTLLRMKELKEKAKAKEHARKQHMANKMKKVGRYLRLLRLKPRTIAQPKSKSTRRT